MTLQDAPRIWERGMYEQYQGVTRFAGRSAAPSGLSRQSTLPSQAKPAAANAVWALAYRQGDRCPGCSRSQWHVGRLMAECAFCSTALPLAEAA